MDYFDNLNIRERDRPYTLMKFFGWMLVWCKDTGYTGELERRVYARPFLFRRMEINVHMENKSNHYNESGENAKRGFSCKTGCFFLCRPRMLEKKIGYVAACRLE